MGWLQVYGPCWAKPVPWPAWQLGGLPPRHAEPPDLASHTNTSGRVQQALQHAARPAELVLARAEAAEQKSCAGAPCKSRCWAQLAAPGPQPPPQTAGNRRLDCGPLNVNIAHFQHQSCMLWYAWGGGTQRGPRLRRHAAPSRPRAPTAGTMVPSSRPPTAGTSALARRSEVQREQLAVLQVLPAPYELAQEGGVPKDHDHPLRLLLQPPPELAHPLLPRPRLRQPTSHRRVQLDHDLFTGRLVAAGCSNGAASLAWQQAVLAYSRTDAVQSRCSDAMSRRASTKHRRGQHV